MSSPKEPIAIIGAGCRFSGSSDRPSKLWDLLKQPTDVAQEIPSDRFNVDTFWHPVGARGGSTNVKEAYFISDRNVRHFDAQFFSMHPSEADAIDPQHRHLLEVVYEGLEDAGLTLESLHGSNTAVFVGHMCNDYSVLTSRDFDFIPKYSAPGIAPSNASSRISYFFNWHGPTLTIDTACSSSLIALVQAVQTLRDGTSDVAIAAGTNLILDPLSFVSESNIGMLSPNGRSRMWDAGADGYARGEGVGAVILKKLSAAIRDGDTIDCIVREVGCNHDGKTQGITMPSGAAQAALIRQTYAKAGLNPENPVDRCQYFEAHGTGTPAGDPEESSALNSAFFGSGEHDADDTLYVGSAKTIIGHTEGTAGLAGVLKAALALKYGVIPPNLHFDQLSPLVKPYYNHLRIPKEAIPWPTLPSGVPRRASVNSFGFGGSNAHAILEAYEAENSTASVEGSHSDLSIVPFVFSANNESSLVNLTSSYLSYFRGNKTTSVGNLRHTLACRRSALPHKITFSASTIDELITSIETRLAEQGKAEKSSFGSRSSQKDAILGIFTGQGAQWPTMGTKLIESQPAALKLIEILDESLQTLPEADRPQWKILDELRKDKDASRIAEAALSQPLCTAVQLVLVDVVRAANIRFTAVVGHSSGEIAAAYAAGFISAKDAIRIAYYRGLHAKSASGTNGCKGAMMAVGTSFEDGKELCKLEDLEGRICVAASNSPNSITLSGDADAIEEAKEALDQEDKFTRVLVVDTAYHSHHMKACAEGFEKSLAACDIEILQPGHDAPTWLSSVREKTAMMPSSDLKGSYWSENMTNTVLFSQAIEHAVEVHGQFNLSLELGPHPALKKPATETFEAAGVKSVEHVGTLTRGKHDLHAVSQSLGAVWAHLGGAAVSWQSLISNYCGVTKPMPVIRDLPLYAWNHNREFWTESRTGKLFRTQQDTVHELLGKKLPDGTDDEIRWKNVFNPKIQTWLPGHAIQGIPVFPATGYISLAMEAAMEVANGQPVQSIELSDMHIEKAIAIDETNGTEVITTLSNIHRSSTDSNVIHGHFVCRSPLSNDTGRMAINASGSVTVYLGEATNDTLVPREQPSGDLMDVDIDKFYDTLSTLGYGYSGPFRGLGRLQRRMGFASGSINRVAIGTRPLLFHPGLLDTSVHSLFVSFGVAGDGQWSLQVPSKIRRVTLVPSLCGDNLLEGVEFDCTMSSRRAGDIAIIAADGIHKCIEIDGLEFVPFSPATEADDRTLFSKVTWARDRPDGDEAAARRALPEEKAKFSECERVSFYYLRNFNETIDQAERDRLQIADHQKALFDYASHVTKQVKEHRWTYTSPKWLNDSHDDILDIMEPYGDDADFNIIRAVGEHLPAVVRGETTMLEVMTKDNMLENYYRHGLGCEAGNITVANFFEQITKRYPHMDILEVGAGTGGATWEVFNRGVPFTSYTYTDVSAGFFGNANTKFHKWTDKMIFKTLDIEKTPKDQGFTEHSYDLILASHCLHATYSLENTIRNVRSLLKPGGFLVVLEIVEIDTMPIGLIMGGLPGWWVGQHEGRRYSPNITLAQWKKLLKKTDFAGIDTFTPMLDPRPFTASVFVAQAVDDRVNLLRQPLASSPDDINFDHLVLLGGDGMLTSDIMDELEDILRPRCQRLVVASSLDELEVNEFPPLTSVLSLTDVDNPVFKDINEEGWEKLKKLLSSSDALLWVTHGAWCEQPDAGTMVGLLRSITYEHQHQRPQLLEVPDPKELNAKLLAELLMRIKLGQQWRSAGTGGDILHTIEPELMLENGVLKILRQMPDTVANNRYNSARREITNEVDLDTGDVSVQWDDQRYILRDTKLPAMSGGQVKVRVERSLLESIRTPSGMLHLSLGTSEQKVRGLALSGENASTVKSEEFMVATPGPLSDDEYLMAIATYLLGHQILSRVPAGATVLIHEPSLLLAAVLCADQAGKAGVKVSFTTTHTERAGNSWIHVHSRMTSRALTRALPPQVDVFLDMSDVAGEDGLGAKILEVLPETCQQERLSSLVSRKSIAYTTNESSNLLEKASSFVQAVSGDLAASRVATAVPIPLKNLPKLRQKTSLLNIVDWRSQSPVSTSLEPIDSSKDFFQDNKTYWMVGLAGDLGQSLCDWMIGHGARYIVLTSRTVTSKVSEKWLKTHAAQGVTIKLIEGDVTDMDSLTSVRNQIVNTLPPIRGVANGSLVLRDRLYLNTDFETFQTVMRPKTIGTSNLDALFSEDTLDWFIGFSSIVATVGNPGQSAYSAGNLYVKAVINQRRQRSLPGATIDIAPVLGVGYVERERKAAGVMTEKMVEKLEGGAQPISESDLHQLFAEAIAACKTDSGRHSDIVTGVRTLQAEDMNKAFWAANLKFSHFIRDAGTGNQADDGEVDKVSVKTKLLEVNSVDEAANIIRAVLTSKLNKTLQYPADQEIPDSTPLIDMGIDSLIAVEVRTWFLQELEVDMPMLKILGGSTIVDMVNDAIARLPESLASRLQKSDTAVSMQPDETPETVPVPVPAVTVSDSDDDSSSTKQTPSEVGSVSTGTLHSVATPLSMPPTPGEPDVEKSEIEFQLTKTLVEPEITRTEPMSFGQTRFWFLKQYLEDQSTSNIAFYFRIEGAFKPDKLRRALELACQRHEGLRTCFFVKDDAPVQGIMRQSAIQMEYHRVSSQEEVRRAYRAVQGHVFDIKKGDTLRLVLCEESPTSFYFILGYDHIAMDGFSWEILFAELQAHYRGAYVPPVTRQYAQWTIKQRNDVMGATLASDRQYWRNQFPALPAVLPLLPMAKASSRSSLKTYEVNRASAKLDKELADLVKTVSQANKVSPFHFHFATFKTLLARLTESTDICIGMADASRMDPADAGVIGLLLNLLPLRFECKKDQTFAKSLHEMRTKVYGAMAHSQVPFNTIIDDLTVPRSTQHHPLFQAFIEYRPAQTLKFADLKGELPEDHTSFARTPYDVELNVLEDHGGGVTISIGCQSQLYSEHAAQLVLKSYLTLLKSFATEPQLPVSKPALYAPEDVQESLVLGKGETMTNVWSGTISHRIEDMIAAYPDEIALKDTLGSSLSYKAMAERVDLIQAALSRADVRPGSVVAASLQPSTDWVCCLLAVLRQGAVFVPLDCSQGALRLQQIVDASSPKATLVNAATAKQASDWPAVIDVEKLVPPSERLPNLDKSDQAAVMLFTSGTTGVPKGVLLQNASLVNVFEGTAAKFGIGRQTVLQHSAFSFDMSLEQTFLALCNGGTLVIVDKSIRGDSRAIMRVIAQEAVTYTKATPAEYSSWFRNGGDYVKGNKTWKHIFAGGDRMTETMMSELRELGLQDAKLLNSYGPVEGTIIATKMRLDYGCEKKGHSPIPVGTPLPNYSIYIVDEGLNLLPPEVPGEIIIGGQGVAMGYHNNDIETGKKFISNPWADEEYLKKGWTKMYRTGDKGHLTKHGELIFHGRIAGDSQVKLRGIRLELEDVERNILNASKGALSEVVCTVREDAASNYLVAHVVLSSKTDGFSPESSSAFLADLRVQLPLPQYMKPSAMSILKSMPLTKHGKIDRAAIAALSLVGVAGEDQDEGELTDLEIKISNLWRKLLPKETLPPSLKRSSDFFTVGGSSLILVEVQSLIRAEFSIDLSLQELYEATVLSKMADKVKQALDSKAVNWDLETAPPKLNDLVKAVSQPLRLTNLEIVMTGATGHLGGFVLQRLISDPAVAKIHCVAVRNPSRIKWHSDKLAIYPGDLSQPQLGLPTSTIEQLAATADAVVHCGATRLNWETFESMRPTNLLSTRELIRLAAPRRLPVHFVSSGGVFPADVPPSESSATAHQPPAVGADGYVASKWASEQLLERSARDLGIPVHIYRTIRADEGSFPEELPEEILAGMAAATVEAGVMLNHGGHAWVGYFDLVSAPGVADSIISAVVSDASQNAGEKDPAISFTNHKGVYRVWKGEQLDSLVYRPEIQERLGRFKMVPPQIWLGEMKRAGFPWMMGASEAAYKGLVKNRR
ncbi:uncharacterized protein E0L32_002372 [Thyridium curvatum]|uniref:Polyketide synthase n=1 Tax=Thyridium curvatum TaxID=1093900 RepID=A0A507AKL5_9PEZI|nr:uncharacterized protein E0L32_002372 [Thyridium curvatum]TPX06876.1 hypothetical protein E0L32_002372 [Thyridium curvatum]